LQGNIVALQSISLATGSSLDGRALAINGAVTLQDNAITLPDVPEPGTGGLMAFVVMGCLTLLAMKKPRRTHCPTK
jgi:hypothetical protein